MTRIESAASRSTTSATTPAACAAETAITNRSTLPGSDATSGTHRHPSISSAPGLTIVTAAGSTPSRSRLRRITWPAFIPDDTPMIAADRGSSIRGSFATGRAGAAPSAAACPAASSPVPGTARTSSATRPPSTATIGLTSSSSRSAGMQASATARNRSTTSTRVAIGRRGGCPRCDSVARRTAVEARRIAGMAARGVSEGDRIAISRPGRRSAASASASVPPAPTLTTGPRSGVQRAEISSDPPRPGS